jgi:fructokinase
MRGVATRARERKSPTAMSASSMSASKSYDVAAFGELVIDLVPTHDREGRPSFSPKPGGAPGNVAVGVARLGGRAAMLSKVGDEAFGQLLLATLAANGVVTDGVLTTREGLTSLAVVALKPDGDRDFMLYRKGCAESTYAAEEVALEIVSAARILHVGSLLLGEPVCAAAQRRAVRHAREHGILVSADVNLRASLWKDPEDMRRAALEAVATADILKVSEEELSFLTGTSDIDAGVDRLWRPALRLLAVTFGPNGAILATRERRARMPSFAVEVVDTVGCGDAFTASLLTDIAASRADLDTIAGLEALARRACAAGAIAATGAGAMDSLPTEAQRSVFLASRAR